MATPLDGKGIVGALDRAMGALLYSPNVLCVQCRTDAEETCSHIPTCAARTRYHATALAAVEDVKRLLGAALAERGQTFDRIAADRLADEVAVLVRRRKLDPRSPAGDALLDYRNPPSSPRADRLAEMEESLASFVTATNCACHGPGVPYVQGTVCQDCFGAVTESLAERDREIDRLLALLQASQTEVAALREELDHVGHLLSERDDEYTDHLRRERALHDRVKALEVALEDWGHHAGHCRDVSNGVLYLPTGATHCDCGWLQEKAALLAPPPGAETSGKGS